MYVIGKKGAFVTAHFFTESSPAPETVRPRNNEGFSEVLDRGKAEIIGEQLIGGS